MKKLVLIFATLVMSLLPLLPSAAFASVTPVGGAGGFAPPADMSWVDSQTINSPSVGPFLYDQSATANIQDSRGKENYYAFKRTSDPDSCPDYIEVKLNNFTNAQTVGINSYVYHLQQPYGGGNNNCQDIQMDMVSPGSVRNAYIIFDWIDSATIRPIQGFSTGFLDKVGGDFILDPNSGNYVQSNGSCNSYIDGVSPDHQAANFHFRVDGDHQMLYTNEKAKTANYMASYQSCYQIKNTFDWITTNGSMYYFITSYATIGERKPVNNNSIGIDLALPANFAIKGDPTTAGSKPAATPPDACANATGAYAWLLCPAIEKVQAFLTGVYNDVLVPLLNVDPLSENTGLKAVSGVFVGLADVFFVIVFLVMIFGTALNLNAYTIKRTLPRIIIAAIAIQFSFYLCGIVIDIANIFGNGIMQLVQSALSLSATPGTSATKPDIYPIIGNSIALGEGALALGVGIAAIVYLGPAIALMLLGLALSILIFILTLVIRKLAISALVILAPLAIAAWVLPNTESLYKKWFSAFLKINMVFPIMSIILSAGIIVQKASGTGTGVNQIIGGLAPILSFGGCILALKMGGPALNAIGKGVSKATGLGAGSSAAMKAGKAPIKSATASFSANRKANATARDNVKFDGGSRAAGLRLGAGLGTGFGLTKGQRKSSADGYARKLAAAQSGQRSLANEEIKNLGTSLEGKDTGKLELNGAGQMVPTAGSMLEAAMETGASAELQQAAIVAMAKQGKTQSLSALRDHMNGIGRSAAYEAGVKRSDVSAIKDKAPQLLSKNGAGAFDGMNAEKLSKLDGTGAQAYVDHLKAQRDIAAASPGTTAATDAQGHIDTFESALEGVRTSSRLSTSANTDGAKIFHTGEASDGTTAYEPALLGTVQAKINPTTGHYIP